MIKRRLARCARAVLSSLVVVLATVLVAALFMVLPEVPAGSTTTQTKASDSVCDVSLGSRSDALGQVDLDGVAGFLPYIHVVELADSAHRSAKSRLVLPILLPQTEHSTTV